MHPCSGPIAIVQELSVDQLPTLPMQKIVRQHSR